MRSFLKTSFVLEEISQKRDRFTERREVASLKEHETSPFDIFPEVTKNKEGLFKLDGGLYPLIFEIKATKPR